MAHATQPRLADPAQSQLDQFGLAERQLVVALHLVLV